MSIPLVHELHILRPDEGDELPPPLEHGEAVLVWFKDWCWPITMYPGSRRTAGRWLMDGGERAKDAVDGSGLPMRHYQCPTCKGPHVARPAYVLPEHLPEIAWFAELPNKWGQDMRADRTPRSPE